MTSVIYLEDPITSRCAMFDENGTSGLPDDLNSSRNAPLNSPAAYLDLIYFHSDFNYLEVFYNNTSPITVAHAAVAASSPTVPDGSAFINFGLGTGFADTLLYTHGLGYVPFALGYVGANILWPGMPVQVDGSGGMRFVTLYATTTEVRLYEFSSTGGSALAAVSIDYNLLVFKDPPVPTGTLLRDFDPSTGVVQMGKGKFNSSRRYLQVVPGGSPLGISYGRTIDLQNGAMRAYRPDGTAFEPVPAAFAVGFDRVLLPSGAASTVFGPTLGYGGSFAFPGAIQVQAP